MPVKMACREINMNIFSPTKKKKITIIEMSFPDAMAAVIKGSKVRRTTWPGEEYGSLKDGFLTIFKNGSFHRWIVNDGDLMATDWVITEGN